MKKIIGVVLALLLCLAVLPATAMAAETDDGWIQEQLRALENQYNSGIALMSFVVGDIPWTTKTDENTNGRQYFTVSGLPDELREGWLADCAMMAPRGYKVDNTGVKYTKFPRYEAEKYHFVNVTVNDVEVVRIGILMPDDDPNGTPVYYYMTQKHVASDETSDGSGSHTGAISALLLPDDAIFQVNYAVNEYKYSYEVRLDNTDVTHQTIAETLAGKEYTGALIAEAGGRTWEEYIFIGQNPSSTTDGAVSFPVNIPYGYTAKVWRYKYDEAAEEWSKGATELTGDREDLDEELRADKVVNEGWPLGTEPVYKKVEKDKSVPDTKKGPSAKTMRAVFNDDGIGQNRKIVVELTKITVDHVFDAHLWLNSDNAGGSGASGRGTTGSSVVNDTGNPGNIASERNEDKSVKWQWGILKTEDPYQKDNWKKQYDKDLYDSYWSKQSDGTWTLNWIFQTNDAAENYILNSLELNGMFIDIPFMPMYIWNDGDQPNNVDNKNGNSIKYATLPDGANVELTFYREFGKTQRVYILKITGARSNITVTGGNLMQYQTGAPEYVATVLTGVTGKAGGMDSFGYFSQGGQWESQNKVTIQVQEKNDANTPPSEKTDFRGDPTRYGANLRFQLQDGYESPVYLWENRVSGDDLEGSELTGASGVISLPDDDNRTFWEYVSQENLLDGNNMLKTNAIYGPVVENGEEWYYIRIGTEPGGVNKMCILTLTATAMKYMVRYMVGSDGIKDDDLTNVPSDDNVTGMPEFSTADSDWDDDLQGNDAWVGKGGHIERYDDNNGNFYDRQTAATIAVSDAEPRTKDGKKSFKYWVVVDKDEKIIRGKDGEPIIVRPNDTLDLAAFADYGVALGADIGGAANNYYVIRLKGVWSDLPSEFKFYIRMVWTDENGKSHIMDLVQNVTTSSTDPNLTEDGCLIVTVNTVTETFQDWFKAHPFYAYAPRNFISTEDRPEDRFAADGQFWEIYPSDFTSGSTEQGLMNPDAYYRVVSGPDGIVRYIVQQEGTIILYLNEVNGSLPLAKTVIGSDPGADEFTYTVEVKLLASDIARASLPQGDPNYLTPESLKNMLPSGSYFGFAPSADMTDLSAFTGANVNLHFKRTAQGDHMADWSSTATFTLKGGEATVLGVPQGSYTITEEAGEAYTVTVETDGTKTKGKVIAGKVVEAGKTATAVKYTNEVRPIKVKDSPRVSTEFIGNNLPSDLDASFDYTLRLVEGDSSEVEYTSEGTTFRTTGAIVKGAPFGDITYNHTGTYVFLVTETLKELAGADENTIAPTTSTRALTVMVDNIDGQLTVTKITVDGTVYEGDTLANAVVPFTHSYMPITPGTVRVIPKVYKKLNGRNLLTASFDFVLTYNGKEYLATNDAAGNGERGTVTFPAIDLDGPDVYTVTVKEKIPQDDGAADHITYDADEITITYTVEDIQGELKVTEAYKDGKDAFENQAYADAGFTVMKNYDLSLRPGGRWEGDTFTVTATLIKAPEGAEVDYGNDTIALNGTAEIELTESDKTSGKAFDFRFTNEGTYTFEVQEKNESLPGVSYDGSIYYVTVAVTAEGKSLAANLSITKNGKAVDGNAVTFDNKFDPDRVNVTVNASKVLRDVNGNRLSLTAGRFRFELVPAGQTTGSILTAKNDANGNVAFLLQNLRVNTYEYILREINDNENGVTYDAKEYAVTVKVEKKQGDSAVTYTIQYANGNDIPVFTNTINSFGELIVSNTVTGDGADSNKEFTYTFNFDGAGDAFRYELRSSASSYGLIEASIMPLFAPESTAVTGIIRNGGSIQLRHGQSVIIYGVPMGASYRVAESDYDNYTVSHDGTAGDTASGTIGSGNTVVNYTNTLNLKEPDVIITKAQAVNGVASGSQTEVKAGDVVTYTITVKNVGEKSARAVTVTDTVPAGLVVTSIDNGGQYENGTITWTIDELNAGASVSVSFTVTVPTVTASQTWTNTAAVVWDGDKTGNASEPVALYETAVGNLMLSKTVVAVGGTQVDAVKEFIFTVKLTDGDSPRSGSFSYEGSSAPAPAGGTLVFAANGEATVTLKHGQTITIKDIPAGLSYAVTEAEAVGYTTSIANGSGRIEANVTAEVSATNTYGLASVAAVPEITKTLTGRSLDHGEFAFEISCDPMDGVTLPGQAVNDADGRVQFGSVAFTKPGTYKVTVREVIPADATNHTKNGVTYDTHAVEFTYVVAGDESGGLTVTAPVVSSAGGERDKIFNNAFADGSGQLVVSKRVTGNAGDPQAAFTFMVMLSDTSVSGAYGDMAFSNGVATFTLKHGESKTATGLPAGIRYSVQEQSANQDGYATSTLGETGMIVANTTTTAIFVNAKDVADIPQTGDNSHIEMWLAMALAALVGMFCCFSIKRRETGIRK